MTENEPWELALQKQGRGHAGGVRREMAGLPRSLTGFWDRLQSREVRLGKLANESEMAHA